MKIYTQCIMDTKAKYYCFRQHSDIDRLEEKTSDYQSQGYAVYSSMGLESDKAQQWIDLQKEAMEASGYTFDPSGAFIG